MNRATSKLPPFEVLAAALRRTTEHLARELAQPTDSAPEWNELEWAIACAAAAMQGTSVLLANRLRWSGPPRWSAFLAQQREQGLLRHERIGALLERIDSATREQGIGCIALKGAALRALAIYRPGERPMSDIDLLVAPGGANAIAASIAGMGYVEHGSTPRHRVYKQRANGPLHELGEHVDNPLRIEVHTAVTEELPVRMVDITQRLWPAEIRPGINGYSGRAALLQHLLLHAAGNMRANSLRQIQIHDIAAVSLLLDDEGWRRLLGRRRADEAPWWAYPPLALAARYYRELIPPQVLRAARAACPRVLRRAAERQSLTRVSWSNLRIHAFPGLAWSRTPLEALRLVRSRIAPSRRELAEIDVLLESQPHFGAVVPWYGVSHGRRILRWLFSQPPRAQTMVSVRASLEAAGIGAR